MEIKGPRPDSVKEACDPVVIYENGVTREVALIHEVQRDRGIQWEEGNKVSCNKYSLSRIFC